MDFSAGFPGEAFYSGGIDSIPFFPSLHGVGSDDINQLTGLCSKSRIKVFFVREMLRVICFIAKSRQDRGRDMITT